MHTKVNFDGLIDGFGNERVALLIGHYETTDQYTQDEIGYLQNVYNPIEQIRWITALLLNFDNEPLKKADLDLMQLLLNKLEKAIGLKIGLCPLNNSDIFELIPIEKFSEIINKHLK